MEGCNGGEGFGGLRVEEVMGGVFHCLSILVVESSSNFYHSRLATSVVRLSWPLEFMIFFFASSAKQRS